MSLVKVSNTQEEIEFNDLEYLTWKDGWSGGGWNNHDVVNNPDHYKFYAVNPHNIIEVAVVVKPIYGTDYDMGHSYQWASNRVYIKDIGLLGETLVDSQSLLSGYKLMYCKR